MENADAERASFFLVVFRFDSYLDPQCPSTLDYSTCDVKTEQKMAEIGALDYGDAEEDGRAQISDTKFGEGAEASDVRYQAIPASDEDDEDEDMDDDDDTLTDEERLRRQQKREAKRQAREAKARGARFYALPIDESVRAGANRGVVSRSDEMDDDELEERTSSPQQQPEVPRPIGGTLDLRYSVLHMQGPPITQCSTSRLFGYITHFGAQPLGLEWVNDHACNVVFANADAARLAIEYLCPATAMSTAPLVPLPTTEDLQRAQDAKLDHDRGGLQQMTEDSSNDLMLLEMLLMPRAAHRFPAKLFTGPERDTALELRNYRAAQQKAEQEEGKEGAEEEEASALPEDVPEIYREMEREDRMRQRNEQKGLALPHAKRKEFEKLECLRGTLWVRWCIESVDVKSSGAARQSKWYRDHGLDAGRDIVTKPLVVGTAQERQELFPGASTRRGGRGDDADGSRRAAMDAELDEFGRQRQQHQQRDRLDPLDEDVEEEEHGARQRWSSSSRNNDDDYHYRRAGSRSLSPEARRRRNGNGNGNYNGSGGGANRRWGRGGGGGESLSKGSGGVIVRGRGAMRAPRTSGWGNDEEGDEAFHYAFVERGVDGDGGRADRVEVSSFGDLGGRMMSDRIEDAHFGGGNGGGGRRRRRGRGGGSGRDYHQGGEPGQSLRDRIQSDDRSLASRLS